MAVICNRKFEGKPFPCNCCNFHCYDEENRLCCNATQFKLDNTMITRGELLEAFIHKEGPETVETFRNEVAYLELKLHFEDNLSLDATPSRAFYDALTQVKDTPEYLRTKTSYYIERILSEYVGTKEGYLKVKDAGWVEFLNELRIDWPEFIRVTGINLSSILDDTNE